VSAPVVSEAVMKSIAVELWVVETPLRFRGIEVGRRMTVIRLASGGLFVHSPAPLNAELREALAQLGDVRFVVPASNMHGHLFMEQYRAAYPAAELFSAPGLARKRTDLAFDGSLGDAPDPRWSEDLDQTSVAGHRFVTEIVFVHRPSGTLIVGDLGFTIGESAPAAMRALARAARRYGRISPTPMFRFGFRDKAAARRSLDRILGWDFDRIVVGHGEVVETGGRNALRSAYAWLS
jgi:glyoxylase-like metal-dependent hydrolase (beta-lactamase superfamily II)